MLRFALRNLMSRPVRTTLSLLGLTVAIAGMVGLFAVKGGLEKTVDDTFRLVPGLTVMQPGAPIPIFSKLPAEWGKELKDIDGVGTVDSEIVSRTNIIDGKDVFSPPRFLLGVDIAARLQLRKAVYRDHLTAGRFLEESDRGTVNAVISRQIARQFNKQVGDTLVADGTPLKIVGIYQTGLPLIDVAIVMDIGKVRELSGFNPQYVSIYYVEKSDPDIPDKTVKRRIIDKFRGRNISEWRPAQRSFLEFLLRLCCPTGKEQAPLTNPRTNDSNKSAVEVRSANDWSNRLAEFSEELDLFLGIMTGIGMTIAFLSIINTMLMSVTERIIEFGILKANGWARGDVMKLITIESGIIGFSGGILGAILGYFATHALNAYWPDRLHLFAGPGLLGFAVVFSTVVGVLAGLYPAIWAMRMMPMDAIRRG